MVGSVTSPPYAVMNDPMRVLIAPDKFAGTLTAVEAADAIAARVGGGSARTTSSTSRRCPTEGPGSSTSCTPPSVAGCSPPPCRGPFGDPVPAGILLAGDTAYVESAQACGLHLTGGKGAESATTVGVGRAGRRGARLRRRRRSSSGSAAAALTTAVPACWQRWALPRTPLDAGAAGLDGIERGRPRPARARLTASLVAATDVDNPLTGLFGATRTFGPQKGIPEERLPMVDGLARRLAVATDRRTSLEKGAGAAGGLGFACSPWARPGARDRPGGRRGAAGGAGPEGGPGGDRGGRLRLLQSRSGKVPYSVAAVAARRCGRAWRSPARCSSAPGRCARSGVESACSLVDLGGEERAFADPAGALADVAARVARTWSR